VQGVAWLTWAKKQKEGIPILEFLLSFAKIANQSA
jgi:hypothetical protein